SSTASKRTNSVLDEWLSRLRTALDVRAGVIPIEESVGLLVAELADWIGTNQQRFEIVRAIFDAESDIRFWVPLLFGMSRSDAPAKNAFLTSYVMNGRDLEKCKLAVFAGLEGGSPAGESLLCGILRIRITNATNDELIQAACSRMLSTTDLNFKTALIEAMQFSTAEPFVRQSLLTLFSSTSEDASIRESAGSSLLASKDPDAYELAMKILQRSSDSEGVLKSALSLIRRFPSAETSEKLIQIVEDPAHAVSIRSSAAFNLDYAMRSDEGGRIGSRLLRFYSEQPRELKIAILRSLRFCNDLAILDSLLRLPYETDGDVRQNLDSTIQDLRSKAGKK
ncbi:MAG: hypothetical protein ACRD2L_14770, partial [Terriglobia bacterium]